MYEHSLPIQIIGENSYPQPFIGNASGLLAKEYDYWLNLFSRQPEIQKHALEIQAHKLADALSLGMTESTITLPDTIAFPIPGSDSNETKSMVLTDANRTLTIKKRRRWFSQETFLQTVQTQIAALEASPDVATATYAGLLRFTVARSMVYDCLPAGQPTEYASIPGEDVPSLPQAPKPGISGVSIPPPGYPRLFYLPQWVAFGDSGQLLAASMDDAESCIQAMEHYLGVLYGAVALAPHMTVDPVYQQKYYGILGQLVNQSRSLSYFRTNEIIATIRRRVASRTLNRGLWITLPYFDDQALLLRQIEFDIIPPGRVMFSPAFIVMAIQEQMTIARHDTALNFSTRKHLLVQLGMIEKAFDTKIN